jgi:Ca-activated chloride channel family protein
VHLYELMCRLLGLRPARNDGDPAVTRTFLADTTAAAPPAATTAQAGAPPAGQFRASADVVEVYATVKLRNGTMARDLAREDFELREDGKPREITVFSRSVQPLSVALVLDHSGSTDAEFANVRAASQEFVTHLLRADRAAISTLSWDCQPFTGDTRALKTVLQTELPRDLGSPIWSATDRAMSSLASEGGRRIVLLLSDGQDNQRGGLVGLPPAPRPNDPVSLLHSCQPADTSVLRTAADVTARAEREAIMVYTVSVGLDNSQLPRLARLTGASHQKLGSYAELRDAFSSIADELHLQYLLGFVPSFTDGRTHTIDVRTTRSGVTVQARKSYVADVR